MPETKTVVLVLIGIYIIAKLVGSIQNKKIRNTIVIIVDVAALVVCIIYFPSLLEKMCVLLGMCVMSVSWLIGIMRHNHVKGLVEGTKKPISLKEVDIPGLLVALGLMIIYFAYVFKINLSL